jgi:soluble lytic murein transglycosylase-like protein
VLDLIPTFRGAPARWLVLSAWLGLAASVQAGDQRYEPMSDAIRLTMSAAISGRVGVEPRFVSVTEKNRWLAAMSEALPAYWNPADEQRTELLKAIRYEAQRAGLDPHLVLGLIEVESNFRRYAVSRAGARGYMQVMPFWTRLLGNADPSSLFRMHTNLRYGCTILRHYLDIERGDLFRALGRYNGSLGKPDYPNAVLSAWRRWERRAPSVRLSAAGQ